MFLILYLKNRQEAQWLVIKNKKIFQKIDFLLSVEEDRVLSNLYKLSIKNKFKLSSIKSFVLLVHDGSLTQIKVVTAIINVLAWQNKAKVLANYNFSGTVEEQLPKLNNKLGKIKKFKALKAIYNRPPEITISQKKHKFKINNK